MSDAQAFAGLEKQTAIGTIRLTLPVETKGSQDESIDRLKLTVVKLDQAIDQIATGDITVSEEATGGPNTPKKRRSRLSSSMLRNIIKGSLFPKDTPAKEFGRMMHEICDREVYGEPVHLISKTEYNQLEKDGENMRNGYFTDIPSNLVKMRSIYNAVKGYLDKHQPRDGMVYTEKVFHMDLDVLEAGLYPPVFEPLVRILEKVGRGVKIRPDYLYHDTASNTWVLKDWKTFTADTLPKVLKDIEGYMYHFQMLLYSLVLIVNGYQVMQYHMVMLPKLTQGGRVVSINVDLINDEKEIKDYLNRVIPDNFDDRYKTFREIEHNRQVLNVRGMHYTGWRGLDE